MTLEPGTKLGNYWRIGALLGEGACAKVYSVKSERENLGYEVVAKVIPTGNGSKSKKDKDQELLCDTLYFEHVLYTGLLVDFPYKAELPLYFSGVDNILKVRYLVMEKFEYDLTHLAKLKPSAAKVSSIGKQLLKGLQLLHSKGYLFIDVKPDNFMMKKDGAYFVDFGLVERIGLNPPGTPRELNGTPTYCSISVHDGNQPSPKDDLEGLGYVLLYLLTGGSLPWNIAKTDAELLRIKKSTDIIQYAQSIGCREIGEFIIQTHTSAPTDYEQLDLVLDRLAFCKLKGAVTSAAASSSSSNALKGSQVSSESSEKVASKPADCGKKHAAPAPISEIVDLPERTTKKRKEPISSPSSKKRTNTASYPEPFIPNTKKSRRIATSSNTTGMGAARSASPLNMSLVDENVPNKLRSPETSQTKPASSTKTSANGTATTNLLLVFQNGPMKDRVISIPNTHPVQATTIDLTDIPSKEAYFVQIGRDDTNDIVLADDATVSSKHATLKIKEDGILIRDNYSTNKTRINKSKISSNKFRKVRIGDQITLGETEFTITYN